MQTTIRGYEVPVYKQHVIDKRERERAVLQAVADQSDGGSDPVRVQDIRMDFPCMATIDELLRSNRLVRGKEAPGVLLTKKGLHRLRDLGGQADVEPAPEPKPAKHGELVGGTEATTTPAKTRSKKATQAA